MRNKDYTATADFLKRFFSDTLHKVELRACPNLKGAPGALSRMTDADLQRLSFCIEKDVDGIGVYFGVCTRQDGATSGNLETVAECPALWVDIDCAKQGISGDDALAALGFLPHPPSIIVNSGGGLHAYWLLEEPVDVTVGQQVREVVTACLRQLALVLAGDTQCAELARILRLPGTMNSKDSTKALYDGAAAVCEVLSDTGQVHDFETLRLWLGTQRAVLHGKVIEARPLNEADPFVAYAREAGYEPAIDVEVELAAMSHGEGHNGIHPTQLRVSMSMIARGYDDDEIAARILAATEAAAPGDARWNWAAEEKAIRKMISTGRSKVEARKEAPLVPKTQPMTNGNAALKLVHSREEEAEEEIKAAPVGRAKKTDDISMLGEAALGAWRERYGPIILSRGTSYTYEKGVWIAWDEQHDQMLRILMQEGCVSLGLAPKGALISAASAYFMNRPSLLEREIEFDRHSLVIAGDGTVDPRTGEIGEHNPDHRAMFKVGANIEGPRGVSVWLQFLREAFSDKPEEEVPEIVRTLQEWFGACLVKNKSRDLSKGMLVHGGSWTGKTQLSEVLRALLGHGQTSATSAADIGSDFGLQGFVGKRGWIADDAIGQDEFLDAERYKKIVTGEEMGVRRKNRTDITARFGFPVMITANHLPKIKDQSDAVYNRSLVLPMTRVRPRSESITPGYDSISAKIIAEELTGILWWAIEGWQRLSARGFFTEPPCMKRAVSDMKDSNNPIGAWLKECATEDSKNKVANADLFASFGGWFFMENGDGQFRWSQNKFIKRVREMMPNLGKQAGAKTRNTTGIRLNEDGLEYWSINASRDSLSKPKGAAMDQFLVNQEYSVSHADRIAKAEAEAAAEPKPSLTDRSPRF